MLGRVYHSRAPDESGLGSDHPSRLKYEGICHAIIPSEIKLHNATAKRKEKDSITELCNTVFLIYHTQ